MSATWTLKRTRGSSQETRHLRDDGWGLSSANLKLISAGRDTLTLTQTKNIEASEDFDNEDDIRLYRDGVQIFRGEVLRPSFSGTAKSEQRIITVAGPWYWAEKEPCVDAFRGNPGQELIPGISKTRIFIDKNGNLKPIGGEVGRLIDNLILAGAPWTKGQIDSRGLPPPREFENVTYSEVIKSVIETVPDVVAWFDYSTGNPTFHLRDPDLLTAINIDASGAEVPAGAPRLEERPNIGRYDDDKVPFVEIAIKRKEPITVVVDATGQEEPRYRSDYDKYRYPAAATGRGGVIVIIEQTDPMRTWDVQAFAQRAYEAFSGILWRGEFTMVGDDIDPRLRPGIRVNFTGARSEWEDMNGLVQEVTHDIFNGRSSATFGPPLQLTPSNLVQKLIALRRQKQTKQDDLRDQDQGYTAGFDPEKNEAAEGGGTSSIKFLVGVLQSNGTFLTKVLIASKGTRVEN